MSTLPPSPFRPPSQQWELVPLREFGQAAVWVWFWPGNAPLDVIVQAPPEVQLACGGRLTLRSLLAALGLPPQQVHMWMAGGMWLDAQQGRNPLLDHPLPPTAPGDAGIVIRLSPATVAIPTAPPVAPPRAPSASPTSGGTIAPQDAAIFEAMEADWLAIQSLETQLDQCRKQLAAIAGRVQSLNRDLSADERQACDSSEIKEWNDVRRWLRDSASQVSRYLRDYTMGVASNAGQRLHFETLYNDHIAPRRPLPHPQESQRDLEMYRKVVHSLVQKMQAVVASASRDGEQRASQFLAKIGAKQRKKREKR